MSRPGRAIHVAHALGYDRDKYGVRPEDMQRAGAAHRQTLTIPLHAGTTQARRDHVVSAVREVVGA